MSKKSRQSTQVLTVQKILDGEELKDFAEMILSGGIDNLVLIYRSPKDNSVHWATNIKQWAMVFGSLDMAQVLMHEEWENQRWCDEEEVE